MRVGCAPDEVGRGQGPNIRCRFHDLPGFTATPLGCDPLGYDRLRLLVKIIPKRLKEAEAKR